MAEDNILNLNKAINTTKKSVDDLVTGVDNLAGKFDRLAQNLKVSAYIDLNSTYTKLVRNIALTQAEAERLSATVDRLSKRTQTYSRQELANMTAMLYKSTGAVMAFRKDFDMLSERFATKYKKDADIYMQSLVKLTEQMPDVSVAMQQGAKDIGTLSQIMRVAGKEGVSAYLAAINQIPDETENSINKTEIQVKKLQSVWANAKVELGKTLAEIFAPLAKLGELMGGFAQNHPIAVGVAQTAGGLGLSLGAMYAQARMIRGGPVFGGAAGAATSTVGSSMSSNLPLALGSAAIYSTGKGFNTVSNAMPKFAGWGRAALGLGGGAALFAGGHALNNMYNEGGAWGQFGTNMLAGAAAGSTFGAPGAIIGAGIGAVGTTAKEGIMAWQETAAAEEEKKRIRQQFLAERFTASYKAKGFDEAIQSVDTLTGRESYVASGDVRAAAARMAQKQAEAKAEAVAAAERALKDNRGTRYEEQATENLRVAKEQQAEALARGAELNTKANQDYERAQQVSVARVGQLQQAIQVATQYGGAGGAGLAESIISEAATQVKAIEGQLATRGPTLRKEERSILEAQKLQAQIMAISALESKSQVGMAGTALTARGGLAQAALFGAGGGGFAETAAMERAVRLKQVEADIAIKKEQRSKVSLDTPQGLKEVEKLTAEISEMELKKKQVLADEQAKIVAGTQAELSARENIYKTYDVKSPELILQLMQDQLKAAEKLKDIELDPQKRKQMTEQVRAQSEAVKYYENYGKKQIEAQQAGQILQMERGAYGALGADTKSLQLGLQLVEAQSKLDALRQNQPKDEAGIKLAQGLVTQLTIEKKITDEVEKRNMYIQKDIELTDIRLERMKTLRAPIGVIADLNRQGLNQEREALKVAERKLEIAMQGNNEAAQLEARNEVERAKNKIAGRLDFERRSYAEMFTETTFGKLGGGSYLFPNDVSKFATMGSGYTTGQSGYGKKGGTYQTQISQMFGAGTDERTSITALYGSLINDGVKIQDGTTLRITGIDNGVATLVKEADKP